MLLRGSGRMGAVAIGDLPDGVFQIASAGKQFIASAVLMLVREGNRLTSMELIG